jgi:hypothetical protein
MVALWPVVVRSLTFYVLNVVHFLELPRVKSAASPVTMMVLRHCAIMFVNLQQVADLCACMPLFQVVSVVTWSG